MFGMPEIRGNGKMAPEIEKIQTQPVTAGYETAKAEAEEERKKKAEEAEKESAKKTAEKSSIFSESKIEGDASKAKSGGKASGATKPAEITVKSFGSLTTTTSSSLRESDTTSVRETNATNPITGDSISVSNPPTGSAFGYGNVENRGDSFVHRTENNRYMKEESGLENSPYVRTNSGLENSKFVTMDNCMAESTAAFRVALDNKKAATKTGSSNSGDYIKNVNSPTSHVVAVVEENAQEFINLDAQERYAIANAKNQEEIINIRKTTSEKQAALFVSYGVEPEWVQSAQKGALSSETIETGSLYTSQFMEFLYDWRKQGVQDQDSLDALAIGQTQSIEPIREQLVETVEKVMPANTTKEKAEELIAATSVYVEAQNEAIVKEVSSGKYSSSVKSIVLDACKKIVERVAEKTKDLIERFFQTEKGKAILNQTRHIERQVQEAKKEYAESLEEQEVAKEQAEAAKKLAEKAMEDAKMAEDEAKSMIAYATKQSAIKIKDADAKSSKFVKYVQNLSPQTAMKLRYAQDEQKKAYWVKWDADSALRLANAAADMARKAYVFSLELAQAKMAAIAINISNYMG